MDILYCLDMDETELLCEVTYYFDNILGLEKKIEQEKNVLRGFAKEKLWRITGLEPGVRVKDAKDKKYILDSIAFTEFRSLFNEERIFVCNFDFYGRRIKSNGEVSNHVSDLWFLKWNYFDAIIDKEIL